MHVGKKMKKGKEKRKKITLKKVGKGLKNATFWSINSFATPAANLLVGEKNNLKTGGRGE